METSAIRKLRKRLTERSTESLQRAYNAEMTSGGMLPDVQRAYEDELQARAAQAPTVAPVTSAPSLPDAPDLHGETAHWSTADLALFLTGGGLLPDASADVFAELVARGVPMSSPVPQCAHGEHAVNEFGARIGLADAYAYRWEPCTVAPAPAEAPRTRQAMLTHKDGSVTYVDAPTPAPQITRTGSEARTVAHVYAETLSDLTVGARVELSPACDAWMQGDRYGNVAGIGRKYAAVTLDRSGRTLKFAPALLRIIDAQ